MSSSQYTLEEEGPSWRILKPFLNFGEANQRSLEPFPAVKVTPTVPLVGPESGNGQSKFRRNSPASNDGHRKNHCLLEQCVQKVTKVTRTVHIAGFEEAYRARVTQAVARIGKNSPSSPFYSSITRHHLLFTLHHSFVISRPSHITRRSNSRRIHCSILRLKGLVAVSLKRGSRVMTSQCYFVSVPIGT